MSPVKESLAQSIGWTMLADDIKRRLAGRMEGWADRVRSDHWWRKFLGVLDEAGQNIDPEKARDPDARAINRDRNRPVDFVKFAQVRSAIEHAFGGQQEPCDIMVRSG